MTALLIALLALFALASTEADEGDVIVASANSAQNSHSATLLTDGRVLVAGGWSGTTAIATFPAQAQEPATFDCAAVTEIPQQECEALVALYASTDGDNWINHTDWLQTITPCTWYGLTCNEGHVTQLEMEWNYLQGTLPPEIGDITHLQVLSLPFSGITGSIPSEIGTLQQLRELRLTGNGFSGPIPTTLGNLTNLEGLFLHYNQLTGFIPRELGNLVNLNRLLLYSNQLSGPIPAELGNMSSLIFLKLQDNQLSGSIPPSLGQLTNLCDLDLSSNQLTGTIPPELGNLTRIGWCSSHAPALYDTRSMLSPALRPLPDARRPPQPNTGYLNLAANHLSGPVPVELGQLTDASGVNIGCNMLSGDFSYAVSRVIRWGSIDYNALTGYDPAVFYWPWYLTQTIAPTNLSVTGSSNGAPIVLNWRPIAYTEHTGYYEISYATAPGGPFAVYGQTADKSASTYTVILPSRPTPYYFRLRTITEPHDGSSPNTDCGAPQLNTVISEYTQVVASGGGQPTPTHTSTPTASPTATATATPTATATATPTATLTATATPSPTPTATATATGTWTPTATPSATATPTASATPSRLWLPLILR